MTTVRQMRRDRMVLSEKVQGRHQDRLAIVYVRQSTLRQVEQHQELNAAAVRAGGASAAVGLGTRAHRGDR